MSFCSSFLSLSQGALFTAVEKPLYLYFIAFVVPSKVLIEVSARFWFLHKNRFFVSQTFPSPFFTSRPGIYWKKPETFFAWFIYVYETLIILEIFDLSNGSALKKFVFTDCSVLTDSAFSFAFSILLFSVWFSLLHKFSVALVYVSKCWVCLCQGLTWEFLICTNPLMRITMKFWCEGSLKYQERGWYDEIKKSEMPKLGDAPMRYPSISQEDSSI